MCFTLHKITSLSLNVLVPPSNILFTPYFPTSYALKNRNFARSKTLLRAYFLTFIAKKSQNFVFNEFILLT